MGLEWYAYYKGDIIREKETYRNDAYFKALEESRMLRNAVEDKVDWAAQTNNHLRSDLYRQQVGMGSQYPGNNTSMFPKPPMSVQGLDRYGEITFPPVGSEGLWKDKHLQFNIKRLGGIQDSMGPMRKDLMEHEMKSIYMNRSGGDNNSNLVAGNYLEWHAKNSQLFPWNYPQSGSHTQANPGFTGMSNNHSQNFAASRVQRNLANQNHMDDRMVYGQDSRDEEDSLAGTQLGDFRSLRLEMEHQHRGSELVNSKIDFTAELLKEGMKKVKKQSKKEQKRNNAGM